jgi:hypothetical protein
VDTVYEVIDRNLVGPQWTWEAMTAVAHRSSSYHAMWLTSRHWGGRGGSHDLGESPHWSQGGGEEVVRRQMVLAAKGAQRRRVWSE